MTSMSLFAGMISVDGRARWCSGKRFLIEARIEAETNGKGTDSFIGLTS